MAESEAPIVCTLSPNVMVDRLTEFETLFARDLTGVAREPLLLRLVFDADAGREVQIRELFARAQECCAFLSYGFQRTGGGLVAEITAPPEAAPTLDGMQALAERNAPPQVLAPGWTG